MGIASRGAPLGSELSFPCSLVSDSEIFRSLELWIVDTGVLCFDPATRIQLFARPWTHVTGLAVEGPETAERRVTAPRVAAFGVLSLGLKKRMPRSYVVVQTMGREDHYFEVSQDPFELRAHLARRTGWLQQHSASLHAA